MLNTKWLKQNLWSLLISGLIYHSIVDHSPTYEKGNQILIRSSTEVIRLIGEGS